MRTILGVLFVGLLLGGCGASNADPGGRDEPAPVRPVAGREPAVLDIRLVHEVRDSGQLRNDPSPEGARPGAPGAPPSSVVPPQPSDADRAAFVHFICPEGSPSTAPPPDAVLFACDETEQAYLLAPASWSGEVKDADVEIPEKQISWMVTIQLDPEATRIFADLSREFAGTGRQFALVLQGQVLAAPTINAVITDGVMQISGAFTEASAHALADALTGR